MSVRQRVSRGSPSEARFKIRAQSADAHLVIESNAHIDPGARRVGAILDRLGERGAVALHDRSIPGSRGSIDHLVVAPSGVWVIDTKLYNGRVERGDVGTRRRPDVRLYVAGRDRTNLIGGMDRQVAAVARALDGGDVAHHAVLCFSRAEWPVLARPFEINGVLVTWPKDLVKRIKKTGAGSTPVPELASLIARRLPRRP